MKHKNLYFDIFEEFRNFKNVRNIELRKRKDNNNYSSILILIKYIKENNSDISKLVEIESKIRKKYNYSIPIAFSYKPINIGALNNNFKEFEFMNKSSFGFRISDKYEYKNKAEKL